MRRRRHHAARDARPEGWDHMAASIACLRILVVAAALSALVALYTWTRPAAAQGPGPTEPLPSEVVSVTTLPSCTNVFGTNTTNAATATTQLCGTATEADTTIIRILARTSDPQSEKLEFYAFPPVNPFGSSQFDLAMPCKQAAPGTPCLTFGENPLTISWSTSPLAVEYTTRALTPDSFPMAYLPYVSLAYWDNDDESDFGLAGLVSSNVGSKSVKEVARVQHRCDGGEEGRVKVGYTVFPRFEDGEGGICACGACRIKAEKEDKDPCFKPDSQDLYPEPPYACPVCCVSGGMHTTNGGNYQDSTCPNDAILGRQSSDPLAIGGRNLIAQAWCQHQAGKGWDKPMNPTSTPGANSVSGDFGNRVRPGAQYTGSGNLVNVKGPCEQYINTHCVPSFDSITGGETGCKDFDNNQGFACDDDTKRIGNPLGVTTGFIGRSAPNIPLRGDFNLEGLGLPSESGTCVVCPALYPDSRYMAGLWGYQRKCYTLMEDFLDSFAVQMRIPYLQKRDPFQGEAGDTLPSGEKFVPGTTAWCVSFPDDPTSSDPAHCFYLDQVASREFLSPCDPQTTGDTCWASYNRPKGFVAQAYTNAQTAPDATLPSQGVEGTLSDPRGPSMTPWWPSAGPGATANPDRLGQTGTSGVLFRCGHYCSPDIPNGPAPGVGNPDVAVRDTTNAGRVKGWAGIGPYCRAYEVSLQGRATATVDFTISYTDASGVRRDVPLKLSTTSAGQGNSIAYSPAAQGVVARINSVRSPAGAVSTLLGGVLVTCGMSASSNPNSAAGAVNGRLGPGWSIEQNPWGTLQKILDIVEAGPHIQDNTARDTSTGRLNGGCPVPIPPYISALQCFDCSTMCAAPWSLCLAIKEICEQNPDLNCEVPVTDWDPDNSRFTCSDPTFQGGQDGTPTVTCPTPDQGGSTREGGTDSKPASDNKAVAWYWMPAGSARAFGTGCGQYGMDASRFGLDEETAQYICEAPGTTTRCVPGVSPDAPTDGVPTPCQMIGGLVNFHGRTSKTQTDQVVAPVCFLDDQLTGETTTGEDGVPLAGPGDNGGCGQDLGRLASLPQGLPYNWDILYPNWWVNGDKMYTSPNNADAMTIDISLYVNGEALNAEVTSISGGLFVSSRNGTCRLQQGSDTGSVPIAVNNTGDLEGNYAISFIGCQGTGDVITVAATQPTPATLTLGPGENNQNDPLQFFLDVPASASFSGAICNFRLSPQGFNPESVILDEASFGCTLGAFQELLNQGEVGVDDSAITGQTNVTLECKSNDFWCWLFDGSSMFERVLWWFVVGVIIAFILAFIVVFIRASISNQKAQTELGRANQLREESLELQSSTRIREQAAAQEIAAKAERERTARGAELADAAAKAFVESVRAQAPGVAAASPP